MYGTSRNNTDEQQSSDDADAVASQLIDSFFLPGGLFDPEDATNAAVVGDENEGMLSTAYNNISDLDSLQQSGNQIRSSRLNQFHRPSSLDYGDILPHMAPPLSEGSGSHNPNPKFSSSDNSTATPAAGVGGLDPNNDQVIVGGSSSRIRQGFDFDRSGKSIGRESISMIPSPQLRSNFDQDVDIGMFQNVPPMSRTPGMPSTIAHASRFQIPPVMSKQSYQNTQTNRIEDSSTDYEWYRQKQYSSYAAIQPPNEFSSLYGTTIRSNASPQNQRISLSTSDIKEATSEQHQNSKLNSNPWINDDLVTLPTSATNQAKYNYNFNFMPSEDTIPSNNTPTDYVEDRSEYSHPVAPFNSKRNDTHRAPPGFIASSSTSQNSQNQTSETTSMRILSSSQMQPLTNSLEGHERRMNYSAVASRNNPVTYHNTISSSKQPQQQQQQQQHIITNHNESNDVSSYSQRHHQLSSMHRPSKTQSNIPSPTRKKSYTTVQRALQQDVDYDFRSQSSRDVPSTIYVEDDAISNSEDTLTVCADSVTVTSLPQNRSERFDMDVVEETSMTEQKKAKAKRHKKKKHKKKHGIQESVKSHDESNDNDSYEVTRDGEDHEVDDNDKSHSDMDDFHHDHKYHQEQPKLTRRNVNTKQNTSRSSAATTANSSTVTQHAYQNKAIPKKKVVYNERSRGLDRKSPKDTIPSKSYLEVVLNWLRHILPIITNMFVHITKSGVQFVKVMSKKCIGLFPGKDKFWFLFPMTCIISDFFFLMCALFTKVVGKVVYVTVILHKLAFLELLDSDSAAMCYSIIYFYPSLIDKVTLDIPIKYQDYVPSVLRWFFVHTYLLRPIKMRDTYIYKVKQELAKKDGGSNIIMSKLFPPRVTLRTDNIRVDYSDRIVMANYILSILRKVAPLIIMLEMNIHRDGFLLYLTSTERILFGYGLSVLRTGYLFSPLIWISWTIQLTIIMFVSLTDPSVLDHCLFVLGLISIRMSHYTVAVEDLEGSNAPHCNSTSSRRRDASYMTKKKSKV